jgi:hypothetical protein
MGGILSLVGGLLALAGAIWIIVIAFQNGDTVWGIVSIFCGIVTLVYGIQHFQQTKVALGMIAGGIVLQIIGIALGAPVAPQLDGVR